MEREEINTIRALLMKSRYESIECWLYSPERREFWADQIQKLNDAEIAFNEEVANV